MYSIVVSSGATIPARAPPSIDMLQTVMRCSTVSARIAEPVYSNTWPVPPPTPISAIKARMMSFDDTPSTETAFHPHFAGLRLVLQQTLRGQHVLDLARADAEGQRAERAVRRRMTVAAHDRHARLGQPELRPDDVHDPAMLRTHPVQRNAELPAVVLEVPNLLCRHLVEDRQRAIGGRNAVIQPFRSEKNTNWEGDLARARDGSLARSYQARFGIK